MSKALIGTLGVLGTASVATPVAVTLSNRGGSEESVSQEHINNKKFQSPSWNKNLPVLSSATEIKTKYSDIKCLQEHFKTITWNSNNQNTVPASDPNFSDTPGKKWGCLMVEYAEKSYSQSKWWGEFRLMWSVSDDTKGLITVIDIKVEKGGLKGSSTSYLIQRENKNSNWETKYAKENSGQTITRDEELKKLIPKAGSSITDTKYTTNDYWGFKPQFSNICGDNDCLDSTGDVTIVSDTWKLTSNNSGIKMHNWSNDLSGWFDNNFQWNDFGNKLELISGDWAKESQQYQK